MWDVPSADALWSPLHGWSRRFGRKTYTDITVIGLTKGQGRYIIIRKQCTFVYDHKTECWVSSGESNPDSSTAVLSFVFFLIFLSLRQQALVICAKIQSKNPCCGVRSGFCRAAFCQVRENHAGNTRWYFQGSFCRIGGKQPAKTYRGSTPHCLKRQLRS